MGTIPAGAGGADEARHSVADEAERIAREADRIGTAALKKSMPDAYVLAEAFHGHYERMAPLFDYETRPESRTEWEKVPIRNRILMTLTAAEVIKQFGLEIPVPDAAS